MRGKVYGSVRTRLPVMSATVSHIGRLVAAP